MKLNENISPKEEKPWEPWQVLLFLLGVLAGLVVIMAVFPKEGIQVTDDLVLRFTTLEEFLAEDTTSRPDMESILAEIDELGKIDSPQVAVDTLGDSVPSFDPVIANNQAKKIQYPEGDKSILYPAFAALEQAASGEKPSRVIHFGDSQIEGDRMTSLIRARFQEKFGGSGPGLQAAVPAVASFSLRQEASETWVRYPGYGRKVKGVTHNRYGVTASFARFNPIEPDSMLDSLETITSWLKLTKSSAAYNKSKVYNTLKLYYGHNRRPFRLNLFVDDAPVSDDSIPVSTSLQIKTWHFDKTPTKMMLFFEGSESPEVYGYSLENTSGVVVDNVGMRGQSGTIFSKLDKSIFKGMLLDLDVKLLLLQYGGNTVPYIKSEKAAENYGNSIRNQINYLKRMLPDISVVVIGPSDMATKIEGTFQTYPYLENVRDALKRGAFEAGAAYFDIYEVMGGRNSMIGWVENEPPLAGKDYVHFNPRGAKKIAQAFVASFMEDYAEYVKRRDLP